MKVILNNNGFAPTKSSGLLPLVPEEQTTLTTKNSVGLLLSTDPTDADTPKFKMQARILAGGEDVRTVLTWKRNVTKIFHGLHITTGPNRNKMLDNLLTDTAHTLYEAALTTHCEARRETNALAAEANTVGSGGAVRL